MEEKEKKVKNTIDKSFQDADTMIWPWLKAEARQIEFGSFLCKFAVHGGRITKAEVSQQVKVKAAI